MIIPARCEYCFTMFVLLKVRLFSITVIIDLYRIPLLNVSIAWFASSTQIQLSALIYIPSRIVIQIVWYASSSCLSCSIKLPWAYDCICSDFFVKRHVFFGEYLALRPHVLSWRLALLDLDVHKHNLWLDYRCAWVDRIFYWHARSCIECQWLAIHEHPGR